MHRVLAVIFSCTFASVAYGNAAEGPITELRGSLEKNMERYAMIARDPLGSRKELKEVAKEITSQLFSSDWKAREEQEGLARVIDEVLMRELRVLSEDKVALEILLESFEEALADLKDSVAYRHSLRRARLDSLVGAGLVWGLGYPLWLGTHWAAGKVYRGGVRMSSYLLPSRARDSSNQIRTAESIKASCVNLLGQIPGGRLIQRVWRGNGEQASSFMQWAKLTMKHGGGVGVSWGVLYYFYEQDRDYRQLETSLEDNVLPFLRRATK